MAVSMSKTVYLNGIRGIRQVGPLQPGERVLTTVKPPTLDELFPVEPPHCEWCGCDEETCRTAGCGLDADYFGLEV